MLARTNTDNYNAFETYKYVEYIKCLNIYIVLIIKMYDISLIDLNIWVYRK